MLMLSNDVEKNPGPFVENYLAGKSLQFSWTRNDVEEKRNQIAQSSTAFSREEAVWFQD
ncbi:hypothetical protein DPMN_131689 [Dreissena polymorpha]|nr:hypothetical protein DPMN_131689 [Dreissena polymorpha]